MSGRLDLLESLIARFPHIPREAVLKEDLLRTGIAFHPSALTENDQGEVKPKSYFIFSFDHKTLPQLGKAALRRPPEEIALTGGLFDMRRTIVSVPTNPDSPYEVARREDGELGLAVDGTPLAEVHLPPMPEYYRHPLSNGKSVMEIAPTIQWGYLIYLTVLRLCQYFGAKEECQFCDINHNWRQHKQAGRPYTGVKPVEEVLEALIAVHGKQHPYVSDSYLSLGKVALYQGRSADAYRYFEQASEIQDLLGADHWRAVDYHYWLARAAYEKGDIDIAELIARLRDIEERFLEREYEYGALERTRARLARMLALSGDRDAAIAKMQEVIDSLERRRSSTSANEADRASASEAWRPSYDNLVAWLVDAGRVEDAYLYAERARSRVMLDQLAAGQVDLRAGLAPAIRADLEEREKAARIRMGELRARLAVVETDNVMPAERRAEAVISLQSALDEAQENYRAVYRDIRARSTLLGSYVTTDGDMAPPRELARRLDGGMAALSFLVGHERSFVFLVRRGAPVAVWEITTQGGESVSGAAIEELVGEYASLSLPSDERGLVSESVTQRTIVLPGPGLRKVLLPDDLWELVLEQASVLVLPDGPLARLPFEAIVTGERDGEPRTVGRRGHDGLHETIVQQRAVREPRQSVGFGEAEQPVVVGELGFVLQIEAEDYAAKDQAVAVV